MRTAKDKAELIYYTGSSVVEKNQLEEVLNELEKYDGTFYSDIEMNGFVIVERKEGTA